MKNFRVGQIKKLNLISFILFVFLFVNTVAVFANPGVTTYQAKIIKPDGLPLEASNVNFKFTILNPAGTCILYSETYSSVNMASTGGLISFSLGSGVKTYPASATTFAEVFSNITPTLSCDAGGPGTYSPSANDTRKIVMQFHDGTGWQTLPAMNINAVPYAMYATEAQKLSGLPTCNPGEALSYNGVSFSCEAISGGGVTSSTIIAALGYEPVQPASVTGMTSLGNNTLPAFSGSYAVGSSNSQTGGGGSNNSLFLGFNNSIDNGGGGSNNGYVIGYNNKIYNNGSGSNETFVFGSNNTVQYSGFVIGRGVSAPATNAIVIGNGYQTLNVMNNDRVGIGTSSPVTTLDVSGGVRIGQESATCDSTLAGTLRYNGTSLEFCNGTSWSGFSGSVTSSTVITALGYTPASSSTLNSTIATLSSVSATAYSVSSTVSSLSGSVSTLSSTVSNLGTSITAISSAVSNLSASMAALTSSQWTTSGTTLNYTNGNVGIGTNNPTSSLTVSGSAFISGPMVMGNTPPSGGVIDLGPLSGGNYPYKAQSIRQETLTDFGGAGPSLVAAEILAVKLNPQANVNSTALGSFRHIQNIPSNTQNYSVIVGDYTFVENDGSGNLTDLYGTIANTFQNGSGTVNTVYGFGSQSYVYNGSATNNIAGYFSAGRGGGTLQNNYGIKIDHGFGNVTNNYGLYISDQTTATASAQNFNLYSEGPYTKNFFEGSVGIGVQVPTAKLHLAAGVSNLAPLKLTSGTLLSSPASGAIEYDGFNLYFTDGANTRRTIATGPGVTSATIASALGYTPANSSTVATLSGTVTTLQNSVASMSASQWTASGSAISFSTGNVGIGTSNPTQALDVSGSIRTNKLFAADGAWNSPSITFANSPGTGFFNNGGYLGFSVNGSLRAQMTNSSFSFNSGGAGPQIYFTGGDAANPSYAFNVDSDTGMFNPNASGGSNELGFSTSGTEKLRITSTGNVGIGNTAPSVLLDVKGPNVAGSNVIARLSSTSDSTLVGRGNGLSFNLFDTVKINSVYTSNAPQDYSLTFTTYPVGEAMRITGSGTVGIGTTSPKGHLDVATYDKDTRLNVVNRSSTVARYPTIGNYNYGGTVGGFPSFGAYSARGSESSASATQAGDGLGELSFWGHSGSGWIQSARMIATANTNFSGSSAESNLIFQTTPNGSTSITEAMRILGSGNVGIGTNGPGAKLQVSGAVIVGAQSGSTDDNADYTISSNGQLHLRANQAGTSNTQYVHLVLEAGTAGSANSAVIMQTLGSERMRVDSTGNVGIGSTAPSARLTVASAGNALTDYTARFQSSGAVAGAGGILFDQSSTYAYKVHTAGTSALTGSMIFSYIDPVSGAVVYDNNLVLRNASVGIGTNNPLKTLHVSNGNSSGGGVQTNVQVGDVGTGTGPLFLTHNAPQVSGNSYYSTGTRYAGGAGKPATIDFANGLHFFTSNNAVGAAGALVTDMTERMTITAAGNVGIGTTSDTLAGKPNKLNIVSSNAAGYGIGISVPNTADSNQIIFVNPNGEVGTVNTNGTTTTFNTASDRRLKGNIRDLEENKIDDIFNRLQPRQWEWKYAEGQPHGEGFIAQELAEVIPDAVTKGDANPDLKPKEEGFKLWKVDYSKLTPYLTAAIQNVRKKIEALFVTTEAHTREIASTQEKVQKLEIENANLKEENKAIKDYLCSKDPTAPICK